jgi:putative protease
MITMDKRATLVLPAGSLEQIQTDLLYGADAVYTGAPLLSLRARAKADSLDEMEECIRIAHSQNKKIYLAVNLILRNSSEDKLLRLSHIMEQLKPDALIVSDAGVFNFFAEAAPHIPLHISTQANVCSYRTAMFWHKLGAKQIVLGRETTFPEIKEILNKKPPRLSIEMFVHGAMCISYSGRCLLSAYMAGRSGNAGECAYSCRWKYKLYAEEELRPGEYFPIEEDANGTYVMSSKDLCLMPHLNEILSAGVDALKIEGRNKSEYYVASTARAYKNAMNDFYNNGTIDTDLYTAELKKLQNRGYTDGFFNGAPEQNYAYTRPESFWRTALQVVGANAEGIEIKITNGFSAGTALEFLSPAQFTPITICSPEQMKSANIYTVPYCLFAIPKSEALAKLPKWTVGRFQINADKT